MSKRHAHTMQVWEDVANKLRRVPAEYQGKTLTSHDSATHAVALACGCCLFADLRSWHRGFASDREIINWAFAMRRIDVYELGSFLGDAIGQLRLISGPTSISTFKQSIGDYAFTGAFIAPFKEVLIEFLSEPTPELFALCSQSFSFLTRLSLRSIPDHSSDEYRDQETDLQSYTPPDHLLDSLSSIIEEWLSDIDLSSLSPKHGKGAVATLTRRDSTIVNKLKSFGTDSLLTYVLQHYGDRNVADDSPYPLGALVRTCEIVSVPKSMKTRRIISKEPAVLQYWQQALRKRIYRHFRVHPYLKDHIDMSDQSANGALALIGSLNQRNATIDLTAASDYVSLHIVRRLFRNTKLFPFLLATRSRNAMLPDKSEIVLTKFAPMGSALCFPIQTLVFASAVELAYRRARRYALVDTNAWRVYGDDIIVDDSVYQDTILILETLGLKVNSLKSYSSPSRFRESCGVEAYDGVDVTPLRISRGFYIPDNGLTSYHASLFESLIELSNSSYDRGYFVLRSFINRMIFGFDVTPPFFVEGGAGGLHSFCPNNYRAESRLNPDLFYRQVRVARVVSTAQNEGWCDGQDLGWYWETLRQIENRSGDMFSPDHRVYVTRGTVVSTIKLVWTSERGPSL